MIFKTKLRTLERINLLRSINLTEDQYHTSNVADIMRNHVPIRFDVPRTQPNAQIVPNHNKILDDASRPLNQGLMRLPCSLEGPTDHLDLSAYQCFLRQQIEYFQAVEEDVLTHTRGRNKTVRIGQVGIRCIHCSHLQVRKRKKGAIYFPTYLLGVYQAAQNINTSHFSTGSCTFLPVPIKEKFKMLSSTKDLNSRAGRTYWAEVAQKIGLRDTQDGIGLM